MPILLTSFKAAKHLEEPWEVFSVARWQSKATSYPELKFLTPVDAQGTPIHTDGSFSAEAIEKYRTDFFLGLAARKEKVLEWLSTLDDSQHIALACWCCPQQAKGRVWFERIGAFPCHTVLIGQLIRKKRPGIQVGLDADRQAYSCYRI